MKIFKIIFAMLFAFTVSQSVHAQSNKSERVKDHKKSVALVQYTCPMHPDIISDKPGKCSKCGMDLTRSKKEQLKQDAVNYTCSMHPEIVSTVPGKCTKCGMNLHLSKKEEMKSTAVNGYACPMDTDVTSSKPGKCPKCGMTMAAIKTKG